MYHTHLLNVMPGSWPTCCVSFHYTVEGVDGAESRRNVEAQSAAVLKWAFQRLATQVNEGVDNIDLGVLKSKHTFLNCLLLFYTCVLLIRSSVFFTHFKYIFRRSNATLWQGRKILHITYGEDLYFRLL